MKIVDKNLDIPLHIQLYQIIKDMIISARKHELITKLEQDLLNDARENGKFVIY